MSHRSNRKSCSPGPAICSAPYSGGGGDPIRLVGAARRGAAGQRARKRAEAAIQSVDDEQAELVELEDELAEEIASITDEMQAKAARVEEVEIPLEKTDIRVADLRLLWVPTA